MFSKFLPYVSPSNLYVVPTYHALLYGVVHKFWSMAFKGSKILTGAQKKTIKERKGVVIATDDH